MDQALEPSATRLRPSLRLACVEKVPARFGDVENDFHDRAAAQELDADTVVLADPRRGLNEARGVARLLTLHLEYQIAAEQKLAPRDFGR